MKGLCFKSLTVVFIFVIGLLEVEETIPPLTSRHLHLLHLFPLHSQLHPCTHPPYRPTPLHTPLALAWSLLLLSVTSPNLFMLLDHQCSTLLGLPLVPSPLLCLFQPLSLSPPSLRKISTDSGTTDKTSE